jgi:predicted ATP-grasp superfamily ATP-dependent carboligase
MKPPLLILGASTRAAAFSAIRAGFHPICGDLYADADLRRFATVLEVPVYPQNLARSTDQLPPMPWIYTGALENWPEQIESVSQRHFLYGNGPSVLQTCRDPWFLQQLFQQHGLPTLELRSHSDQPANDDAWLRKPLRSSAGRAIRHWTARSPELPEAHYFQRFQHGAPISATFIAGQDVCGTTWSALLGVACQLQAQFVPGLHAPDFGYCGSIVPARIEDLSSIIKQIAAPSPTDWPQTTTPIHADLQRLGTIVSKACRLDGLFGIDLIWDGTDLWPLEVNPRYTASMELLEQALEIPLLDWQHRVCQSPHGSHASQPIRAEINAAVSHAVRREAYFGKVILYADRDAKAPDLTELMPRKVQLNDWPTVADIPVTGSQIESGQPVLTCLHQAAQAERLLNELLQQAERLWTKFQ